MASPRKKMKIRETTQDDYQKMNTQNRSHNLNGGKKIKIRGRKSYFFRLFFRRRFRLNSIRRSSSRRNSMGKRSIREEKIKDNGDENSNNKRTLQKLRSDLSKDLPNLHMEALFGRSSFFQEFHQEIFRGFDERKKLCLWCVTVFPENAVIKKRVLVHWWVGEGLLDSFVNEKKMSEEEIASDLLKEFVDKKFIYSVKKKGRKVMNSFRMYPLVRSAMITLAQKDGFCSYISEIDTNTNFRGCRRVCLVDAQEGSVLQNSGDSPNKNQGKLQTLFNISYQFPDFKIEQLKTMRDVKVLYLGTWASSEAKSHHIEVEGTEFLKGLKYMKSLRLLSLQGIFGIREIPSSIKNLEKLKILDLKACYNLEKLPKEVASLKLLSHLDISGCYLMDHMPKELSSLTQRQVLKGFVIGDPSCGKFCTLAELTKLEKLRKLSININTEFFNIHEQSNTLSEFKKLLKLKIAWGRRSSKAKPHKISKLKTLGRAASSMFRRSVKIVINATRVFRRSDQESKCSIEKLDLQCFPDENLPSWLTPKKFEDLKKLYIRGGRLKSLGEKGAQRKKWTNIKHLRLKYLRELDSNWGELKELFPNLQYLENFKCPNVTFCPCDGTGVWVKPQ